MPNMKNLSMFGNALLIILLVGSSVGVYLGLTSPIIDVEETRVSRMDSTPPTLPELPSTPNLQSRSLAQSIQELKTNLLTSHNEAKEPVLTPTLVPSRIGGDDVQTETEFTLDLVAGWNLISFPLIPYASMPSEIFFNHYSQIEVVWQYTLEDDWLVWNPDANDYANSLKSVNPLLGLWVKTNEAFSLSIYGSFFDSTQLPLEEISGWVMAGYPLTQQLSMNEAYKLGVLFSEVKGLENGNWYVYAEGGSTNNLTALKPGLGYWVNVLPRPDRTLIMNEVMFDPLFTDSTGSADWVELYNPTTSSLAVDGFTLTDAVGTVIATLPDVAIPSEGYLVCNFTVGTNDLDFSDGSGTFYLGYDTNELNDSTGQLGLYQSSDLGASNLLDYVSWGMEGGSVEGLVFEDAIQNRYWAENASVGSLGWVDHLNFTTPPVLHPLAKGESIGRDQNSTSVLGAGDWYPSNGYDANVPTPGEPNRFVSQEELVYPVAMFDRNETQSGVSTNGIWSVFNGSYSYDPDGTVVDWQWDFDDGTTDSGAVVNHTFSPQLFGLLNYTVTLTVTDDDGLTNSTAFNVTLWHNETQSLTSVSSSNPRSPANPGFLNWVINGNMLPDVALPIPTSPVVFSEITFDLTQISDPDNTAGHGIYHMIISWGDGTTWDKMGRPDTVTHKYIDATTYQIQVHVVDDDGQSYSIHPSITVQPLPSKRWTFLFYGNGDSNLDRYIDEYVNEMEEVGSNSVRNLLAYGDYNGVGNTKRFYVGNDTDSAVISSFSRVGPEKEMGSAAVLVEAVEWASRSCPSTYFVLFLFNHGDTWEGVSFDHNPAYNYLKIDEVKDAFETIKTNRGGDKIDVLFWDDCLMGTVEVGYQMRNYVDYMIASPEVIWTSNKDYSAELPFLNSTATPLSFSKEFAKDYASNADSIPANNQLVAVWDLSKMDSFKFWFDLLVNDLMKGIDDYRDHYVAFNENFADLIRVIRRNLHEYQSHSDWYMKAMVDFYQLLHALKKDKAKLDPYVDYVDQVISSFDDVLVYNWSDTQVADCRASIYFPRFQITWDNPKRGSKYDSFPANDFLFVDDTRWDEFVREIFKPVADAGESKCVLLGQEVEFNALGTSDFDDSFFTNSRKIDQYHWDFGDGNTASDTINDADTDWQVDPGEVTATDGQWDGKTKHRYTDPGTYTVNLTVIDRFGNSDQAFIEVCVKDYNSTHGGTYNNTWTIMIYASAEGDNPKLGLNNLDDLIEKDLNEIELVNTTEVPIQVVAQVDYHTKNGGKTMFYDLGFDASGNMSTFGNMTTRWEVGEDNTGCGSCGLEKFVYSVVGNQSLSACNYMLVLWDRSSDYYGGDGWKASPEVGGRPHGLLRNTHPSNDVLELVELQSSLSNIKKVLNRSIDILMFDASMMGMIEVADMIKGGLVNIMVSSEAPIGPEGLNYTFWYSNLKSQSSMTTLEMAKNVVNAGQFSNDVLTMSAINLSSVDGLVGQVNALASQLIQEMGEIHYRGDLSDNTQILVRDVRQSTMTYGLTDLIVDWWDQEKTPDGLDAWDNHTRFTNTDNVTGDMDFIDLMDFLQGINNGPFVSKPQAKQAIDSFKNLVVANYDSFIGSNGLSIYFPYQDIRLANANPQDENDDYLAEFSYTRPGMVSKSYSEATLFARTMWDEFLEEYYKPVADIGFKEITIYVGESVSFNGRGSSDTDFKGVQISDLLASYAWNFGDGGSYNEWWNDRSSSGEKYNNGVPDVVTPGSIETSTPPVPDGSYDGKTTHIYDTAGDYTATLTVKDDDGKIATDNAIIHVLAEPYRPPKYPLYYPEYVYTPPTGHERYYTFDGTTYGPIEYVDCRTQFVLSNQDEKNIFYRLGLPNGTWLPSPSSGSGLDNNFYLYSDPFSFPLDMEGVSHYVCYESGLLHVSCFPTYGDRPYIIERYDEPESGGTPELDTQYYFIDVDPPQLYWEPVYYYWNPEQGSFYWTQGYSSSGSPSAERKPSEDMAKANITLLANDAPFYLWNAPPEEAEKAGSGVNKTMYQINSGPWENLSGSANITLGAGLNTLSYYGRDNMGHETNYTEQVWVSYNDPVGEIDFLLPNGSVLMGETDLQVEVDMGRDDWFYQGNFRYYRESTDSYPLIGNDVWKGDSPFTISFDPAEDGFSSGDTIIIKFSLQNHNYQTVKEGFAFYYYQTPNAAKVSSQPDDLKDAHWERPPVVERGDNNLDVLKEVMVLIRRVFVMEGY